MEKPMSRHLLATVTGALCAIACPALAQEWVITVPVNISAMPPEIRELEINCTVYALRPGSTTAQEAIGSAIPVRRPVTGGAFMGDVVMNVNRNPLAGDRAAVGYGCHLRVYGTIAGRPAEFFSYDDPTTGAYGLKMPPGSPIRLEIPARPGAPKLVAPNGRIP